MDIKNTHESSTSMLRKYSDMVKEMYNPSELTERRQGLFGFVQQSFPYPPWPPYIVNDWHYKTIKDMQSQEEIAEYITTMNQIYGKVQWREQPLEITLNIFDPGTQQRIKQRVGGTANPMGVYNDAERHTTAQQLLQQKGISKEPIIVVKTPQGYELLEGWHRTIQYLQAFPQGYTGPAWVGTGPLGSENITS